MSDTTEALAAPGPDTRQSSVLEGLVPDKKMAEERHLSQQHQRRERQLGIGPPYIRIGRRIYYRREAVRAWMLAQERQPRQPRKSRR